MKKARLATLISALVFLSACNEKETQALTEKLQQAEQTITKLNQDLAKSQQNLTAYQAEQQKQATANTFPMLKVTVDTLFKKAEKISLQNAQKPNGSPRTEADIDYLVTLPQTGFDWLDNLLARQILNNYEIDAQVAQNPEAEPPVPDPNKITGNEKADLLKALEKGYAEDIAMLKEGDTIAVSNVVTSSYLGQREHLVTFALSHYTYGGGAHGMFWTNYINIDVEKKTVVQLQDLIAENKQDEVKKLLWQAYQSDLPEIEGKKEPFVQGDEFQISEDFLLTEEGVKFIYPPYTLGAFAEGEISLIIPWDEANLLLNKPFQRPNQAAYNLSPTVTEE